LRARPLVVLLALALAACDTGSRGETASKDASVSREQTTAIAASPRIVDETAAAVAAANPGAAAVAPTAAAPATGTTAPAAVRSAAPDPIVAGAARAPIVPPVVAVTPVANLSPTPVQSAHRAARTYELVGTTLAPGRDSAVLRDTSSQEHWTVHAGDHIDDVSVSEIKADRVVLTSAQGPELVFFRSRSAQRVADTEAEAADPEASQPRFAPVPQYTGPSGETPTYEEPAQEGQPTGH